MSPIKLGILMHYYCFPSEYPFQNSKAESDAVIYLLNEGLLIELEKPTEYNAMYKITKRGLMYMEMITSLPLPQSKTVWVNPLTNEVVGEV